MRGIIPPRLMSSDLALSAKPVFDINKPDLARPAFTI